MLVLFEMKSRTYMQKIASLLSFPHKLFIYREFRARTTKD